MVKANILAFQYEQVYSLAYYKFTTEYYQVKTALINYWII